MRIIFVCTSNVCRSPPAAALAAKWLHDHHNDGEVISRSISTDYEPENSPASEYSVQIMKDDFGIDISSHRSKLLTEEDIQGADLIVGITSSHRHHIVNKFPIGLLLSSV
jgi:protein-tyrosine-phosphatase